MCARALPQRTGAPVAPAVPAALATPAAPLHHNTRQVSLPPRCGSAFIGRGGRAVQEMVRTMESKLAGAGVAASVRLQVKLHAVVITVRCRLALHIDHDFRQQVDALAEMVREEVDRMYRMRLQRSSARRAAVKHFREEQGRRYHADLHFGRILRRELPGAARALELPSAGVDGFGSIVVRPQRVGGPVGEYRLRKGALLRRRRALLRAKRRQLLLACTAASRSGAAAMGGAAWQEQQGGTRRMRTCQQLLASAHLNGRSGSTAAAAAALRPRRRDLAAARRLRRHLAAVSQAAGQLPPGALQPQVRGTRGGGGGSGGAAGRLAGHSGGMRLGAKGRRVLAAEIAQGYSAAEWGD
mmetsp:Transcript_136542/g.424215  ORF Transcript_136542/g.424215 Transcript_136542/m.424215 type:complete len:355 (-) Transcript_136542:148-1212(-)